MRSFDTLVDAVNDLQGRGYTNDFGLRSEYLECKNLQINIHPENFKVEEVYRFEGMSNTDDNSVVYAITSSDGLKGILVDAYGVYAEHITEAMRRKLR